MIKTWCVGGRHYSESVIQNVYETLNPRTKIFVKVIKGTFSFCGRIKSQNFNKYITRAEKFNENAKCKHEQRSTMSNSAWCDINKD